MALQDRGDAVLSGAVSAGDVPGVLAGLTSSEDTIYQAGFGERVLGSGDAMTPDSVGRIASMTKAEPDLARRFTTAGVVRRPVVLPSSATGGGHLGTLG